MLEHLQRAHKGGHDEPPKFKVKIVKGCKSALERQVREGIRIQLRGEVLNKRGEFNRCKLTRMTVDTAWEDKKWEESSEVIEAGEDGLVRREAKE